MNYFIQTVSFSLAVSLIIFFYSKNKIIAKLADELSSLLILAIFIASINKIENPFFLIFIACNIGWTCVYIYNNPFYVYNFLFKEED